VENDEQRSFHAEARRTAEGTEDRYCRYNHNYTAGQRHRNDNHDRTGHYRNVFSRGGAEARGAAENRHGSLAGRGAYARLAIFSSHERQRL
jgi:hypothetical protein